MALTIANGESGSSVRDKLNKRLGRVFTTSGAGAISDADVSLGSSTFGTDNYAVLQALLDEAANGAITIIWDGKYSINQYLVIRGNTTILGTAGSGVILRNNAPNGAGTDGRVFRNQNLVSSSSSGGYGSNIVDENITIDGLIINGNNPNQGASSVGHMIQMAGVRNLRIQNCLLLAPNTHTINVTNWEHIYLINNKINHGTYTDIQHDGYHLDGYGKYATISGASMQNGNDDVIAIMPSGAASAAYGPVSDVDIRNITLTAGGGGIRIAHGNTGFDIQRVNIDGVHGTTTTAAIRLSTFNGTTGICENLSISNIDVEVTAGATISIPSSGTYRNISIANIFRNAESGNSVPLVSVSNGFIFNLKISHFTGWYDAATQIVSSTGGTIQALQITDAEWRSSTGTNLNVPLVKVAGGTVNTIQITNAVCRLIDKVVEITSGTVSEVQAVNVRGQHVTAAFYTDVTVANLLVSNYLGTSTFSTILGGSGAFTTKRGNALDYLGVFTVATVPDATLFPGAEISISNESGGYVRAFSDGTNWCRVTDRAIVS